MGPPLNFDSSSLGAPPSTSQSRAYSPGAQKLTAVTAILKGLRQGYLNRQIKQYNELEWSVEAARNVRDDLMNQIKQNPGQQPTQDQAAKLDQYNKALAEAVDKIHALTVPKSSGGKGAANNPQQSKFRNAGEFVKRMLLGPKAQFPQWPAGSVQAPQGSAVKPPPGVTTTYPQSSGVPSGPPPTGGGVKQGTQVPNPQINFQPPPASGPTQSLLPVGQVINYNGQQYRVVSSDPRNTVLEPVSPNQGPGT